MSFQNRGASHRIAAYKRFQGQGYHTLTLDYRGWGDSVMAGGTHQFTFESPAILENQYRNFKLQHA